MARGTPLAHVLAINVGHVLHGLVMSIISLIGQVWLSASRVLSEADVTGHLQKPSDANVVHLHTDINTQMGLQCELSPVPSCVPVAYLPEL